MTREAPQATAAAFARVVLPVPGGPYNSTPRGGRKPNLVNTCGTTKGRQTKSIQRTMIQKMTHDSIRTPRKKENRQMLVPIYHHSHHMTKWLSKLISTSGFRNGNSMASRNTAIWLPRPPTWPQPLFLLLSSLLPSLCFAMLLPC